MLHEVLCSLDGDNVSWRPIRERVVEFIATEDCRQGFLPSVCMNPTICLDVRAQLHQGSGCGAQLRAAPSIPAWGYRLVFHAIHQWARFSLEIEMRVQPPHLHTDRQLKPPG